MHLVSDRTNFSERTEDLHADIIRGAAVSSPHDAAAAAAQSPSFCPSRSGAGSSVLSLHPNADGSPSTRRVREDRVRDVQPSRAAQVACVRACALGSGADPHGVIRLRASPGMFISELMACDLLTHGGAGAPATFGALLLCFTLGKDVVF